MSQSVRQGTEHNKNTFDFIYIYPHTSENVVKSSLHIGRI